MTAKSMFAYIIPRFTNQRENVATDALLYLLQTYPIASKAFISYISQLGGPLSDNLKFETQIGLTGGARPDLTGVAEDGQRVLVVESKFWAPLTEKQPSVYLEHLTPDKEGVVLFIAPSSRFPTLWTELMQRCDLSIDNKNDQSAEYRVAKVGSKKLLGLVSWESVLSYLKQELEISGVIDGGYEVWQLQSLCERLDAEAFHPLKPQDLQSKSDERIRQYHLLVNDLVDILVKKGYASTKGYRATPSANYRKRYMTLYGKINWCVEYNGTHWEDFRITPIWLTVHSTTHPIEKLNPLRQKSPSSLFESDGRILIPLELPFGVEREDILKSLVRQIEEVESLIRA